MQEPELEENALTARVAAGRLTIERRSTDPAPPGQVTVTDPDGKTRTLSLAATSPGKGDCQSAGPDTGRVAGERRHPHCLRRGRCRQSAEFADLRATATLLRKLVRASGGGVHFIGTGVAGAPPDRAGTAPHRARPVGGRQFVDRAGAAARSRGDRDRLTGAAAVLDRTAADAWADGARLASRGAITRP